MSEENIVPNETPNEVPDVENEARSQGWVGQDEFRGKEEDWVDAETFVRRGKEIMPILRKNNEKLLKELNDAKKAANEAREAAKEFREYQKELTERKVKDLNSQIEQLKQAKREAISSGDGDRVIAIDDAIDDIKTEQQLVKDEAKAKEATPPETPQLEPSLQEWLDKNEWFGKDSRATAIANGIGADLRQQHPNVMGQEFLDLLDQALEEEMPARFGKKKTPNPMDGGSNGSTRPNATGKKGYNQLPADAKAACDRFVSQGLMTKEEYVSNYEW